MTSRKLVVIVLVIFSLDSYGQYKLELCNEIEVFTSEVLDSSFFFKEGVPDRIGKIVSNEASQNCEFYPLALTIIGFHKHISGDVFRSRNYLLRADSLYVTQSELKDKYYIRNKIFLGLAYNIATDTIKSIRYLNEAKSLAEKYNNKRLLADAVHNLGTVYHNSGLFKTAKGYLQDALILAKESGNLEIEAFANLTISRISRSEKAYDRALIEVENAEKIFKRLDYTSNLYMTEKYKGDIYLDMGETQKAIQQLKNAAEIGNTYNHTYQHSQIYLKLGDVYQDLDVTQSIAYYELLFKYGSNLDDWAFARVIENLTKHYKESNDLKSLSNLLNELSQLHQSRKELIKVELLESNRKAIAIQKANSQADIFRLRDDNNKKIMGLILLASLIVLLFAFNLMRQLKKNRSLNKKVNTQNRQLENQNIELKNFAYMASHDLKAPVRSISSFTTLIKRKLPPQSDPKVFEYLDIIESSSLNMDSLVNGLLEFSTLEKANLDLKPISTFDLIDDVQNNLYSVIEKRNAHIIVSKDLPVQIKGDETLLKIVFQNLINNAVKFVSPDKNPIVKVSFEKNATYHKFLITDNGIGISQENIDKVFLMFQRLNASHDYEGTGIGLSTCDKIVKMHNGKIEIESTVNVGSTFKLYLPK